MPRRAPRWLHETSRYPSHELPLTRTTPHTNYRTRHTSYSELLGVLSATLLLSELRVRDLVLVRELRAPSSRDPLTLSLSGVRTADSACSGSSSPVPRPLRADRVPRPPKTRTIDYVPCYIEYSIDPYFTVGQRKANYSLTSTGPLTNLPYTVNVHTVHMYNDTVQPATATRATHPRSYAPKRCGESHTRTQTLESDKDVTQTHSYTRRPAEPGGSAYGVGPSGAHAAGSLAASER